MAILRPSTSLRSAQDEEKGCAELTIRDAAHLILLILSEVEILLILSEVEGRATVLQRASAHREC
jgi:hypothetical protein